MRYEVCHIHAPGSLLDKQIEEKLNAGWEPFATVVNLANDTIMYFRRPIVERGIDNFGN